MPKVKTTKNAHTIPKKIFILKSKAVSSDLWQFLHDLFQLKKEHHMNHCILCLVYLQETKYKSFEKQTDLP